MKQTLLIRLSQGEYALVEKEGDQEKIATFGVRVGYYTRPPKSSLVEVNESIKENKYTNLKLSPSAQEELDKIQESINNIKSLMVTNEKEE